MKDRPHLRGAAESYNSLKEAFSSAAPFVKADGGNSGESFTPFLLSPVARHTPSPPRNEDDTDLSSLPLEQLLDDLCRIGSNDNLSKIDLGPWTTSCAVPCLISSIHWTDAGETCFNPLSLVHGTVAQCDRPGSWGKTNRRVLELKQAVSMKSAEKVRLTGENFTERGAVLLQMWEDGPERRGALWGQKIVRQDWMQFQSNFTVRLSLNEIRSPIESLLRSGNSIESAAKLDLGADGTPLRDITRRRKEVATFAVSAGDQERRSGHLTKGVETHEEGARIRSRRVFSGEEFLSLDGKADIRW
ncbi:uncharacterized protein V6R79_010259 [Siganus canaliculatus]